MTGLLAPPRCCWPSSRPSGIRRCNLTLDLSGVTGVIVSVGITVDSYIVYFERLKDEVRAGRSVRTSVDRSFKGAFRTVLAADLVSLAAAVVLYLLAVGTVRGFAFFLGSVDAARRVHDVLLHPAARHPARAQQRRSPRPAHRGGAGPGPRTASPT